MDEKRIDYEYDSFTSALIPFGSLDIRTAVRIALEVEEDGEWLADCLEEDAANMGMNIFDLDVVATVYDAILQEARSEIEELTGFDFMNDDTEVYTAGNYVGTCYDFSGEANKTIKNTLIKNNIEFESLSVKTRWFLDAIDANY